MKNNKHFILLLGDQLNEFEPLLIDYPDATIIMIEAYQEAEHVPSQPLRTAYFLTAMRCFHQRLLELGRAVIYLKQQKTIVDGIKNIFLQTQNEIELHIVEPGEHRLKIDLLNLEQDLEKQLKQQRIRFKFYEDTHFLCSIDEFKTWAQGKKSYKMEYFYRFMRQKYNILMQPDNPSKPLHDQWNFDADNRNAFPKSGPGMIPSSITVFDKNDEGNCFSEKVKQEVILEVTMFHQQKNEILKEGWGQHLTFPVTRQQALLVLQQFINERLYLFGTYQDAMWEDTPFAYHSLISMALNVKLLQPLEVIDAVLNAPESVTIAAKEGFIRQILGWREFMRGVYHLSQNLYLDNHFNHENKLPSWFWNGQTKMNCLSQVVNQTLEYGYAHHIQRLMILCNFSILAELKPQEVHDWFLAVYVDAIQWVQLPNTAGMGLFANGGTFTTKPYISSGAYIKKMSNYCTNCHYNVTDKNGSKACPFTALYWNFLQKHEEEYSKHPRMALMVKHLKNWSEQERIDNKKTAVHYLQSLDNL